MQGVIFGVFQAVVLIYSVVLHELSHGYMALSMGDHTAERMGRLSLNPLKHLDPFGSVLLPLLTWLVGGFLFGYAKPVPYNPANLNDKRWGPAKVGIAGPLANFTIAAIFAVVMRSLGPSASATVVSLLTYTVSINLVLAVFNLIPIPPLDGHWLLFALLPARSFYIRALLYRYEWVLLIVALLFVMPLLYPLVGLLFRVLTGMPLF